MTEKILIILDLDETLIHASNKEHAESHDFELFGYKIFKRPFLNEFLEKIKQDFRVAVWSSASDDYVEAIVKTIFPDNYPLEFVWGRSRCTYKADYDKYSETGNPDSNSHFEYIKRLDKLRKKGFDKNRILIIDDTRRKSMHNYGNAIYPSEFSAQQNDDELFWLAEYLLTLKHHDSVRTIEKRNWKNEIRKKHGKQ